MIYTATTSVVTFLGVMACQTKVILKVVNFLQDFHRVAKCHGYGGYIRVKILEGWGKKSVRIQFCKIKYFFG